MAKDKNTTPKAEKETKLPSRTSILRHRPKRYNTQTTPEVEKKKYPPKTL